MSENQTENERPFGVRVDPAVLLRVSSLLFFGLMLGHMSAFPWASDRSVREMQLVDAMKSTQFEFLGERSTYWSLYFGWGLLVGVLLLTMAIILWLSAGLTRIVPGRSSLLAGSLSAASLAGAYLSFRYFYRPPFLCFSAACLMLLIASVQLQRQRKR